jgi:hypothetical protein
MRYRIQNNKNIISDLLKEPYLLADSIEEDFGKYEIIEKETINIKLAISGFGIIDTLFEVNGDEFELYSFKREKDGIQRAHGKKTLNADEVKQLYKLIKASKILSMSKSYTNDIYDGTQIYLTISQESWKKRIFTSNYISTEIDSLIKMLGGFSQNLEALKVPTELQRIKISRDTEKEFRK